MLTMTATATQPAATSLPFGVRFALTDMGQLRAAYAKAGRRRMGVFIGSDRVPRSIATGDLVPCPGCHCAGSCGCDEDESNYQLVVGADSTDSTFTVGAP